MDLKLAEETKKAEAAAKLVETKMLDAPKLAQEYQEVDVVKRQQARIEDLHARRKTAKAKLAQFYATTENTSYKRRKKCSYLMLAPIELKQPRREGGNVKLRSTNTVKGRTKKETGDMNTNKDDVSSEMKDLTIRSISSSW
eukprot:scaffold23361_cov62-Attheya_sp.AAC.2